MDRRIWYAVAAVIIVLIIIGYATGWFSHHPHRHPSSKQQRRMQRDQGESPIVTDDAEPPSSLAQLTAEIVSTYVSHTKVAPSDLAALITTIYTSWPRFRTKLNLRQRRSPSQRSPYADHFAGSRCLSGLRQAPEDAQRHLAVQHELTPPDTALFGLNPDYPMAAPNYIEQRREVALATGSGAEEASSAWKEGGRTAAGG